MQDDWDDHMANNIDFSDDEDLEEEGGLTIKNAAKYADFERKPETINGVVNPRVNELGYYKRVEKITVYPFDKVKDQIKNYKHL